MTKDGEAVFRTTCAPDGRVLASSGFVETAAPFSPTTYRLVTRPMGGTERGGVLAFTCSLAT